MRRGVGSGILALWVATAAQALAASQVGRPSLERLVEALDLTERGAAGWLSTLTRDLEPQQERALLVTTTGAAVDSLSGQAGRVRLTAAFDARLLQPGSNLVLVHNHPQDTGLSGDDLLQLGKPGVVAVAVVGHQGSVYVAIAGPAYDPIAFEHRQYALARAHLTSLLHAREAFGLPAALAAEHRAHLTSLVLAHARIIEYRATLSSVRRESFEWNRPALMEAVVFAAGRLKAH